MLNWFEILFGCELLLCIVLVLINGVFVLVYVLVMKEIFVILYVFLILL